jgi:LysM repeat protein
LFNFAKTDYKAWANGLQKAGYATSQTYANSLISIIERYKLYKYDYLSFRTEIVAAGETDSIFKVISEPIIIPIDTIFDEPHYVLIPDPFGNVKDSVRIILTKSTFEVNGLLTVFVQTDDDLFSIAKRYKCSERKLKKNNEFSRNTILRAGQYVFLEKKKKSYSGKEQYHTVLDGQSIYDISQHYGIQKSELLKINKVYKCSEPKPGTLIRLKKDNKN